jgi:hypothetical protein
MPWSGKDRSDVPSTWASALEHLLEAVDPTHEVAEFVLTGQPAAALKNSTNGRRWLYGINREAATSTSAQVCHSSQTRLRPSVRPKRFSVPCSSYN